MVVKLWGGVLHGWFKFESGVVSYGSQAQKQAYFRVVWFESGVVSYGSQALMERCHHSTEFESGVVSYGSQANRRTSRRS